MGAINGILILILLFLLMATAGALHSIQYNNAEGADIRCRFGQWFIAVPWLWRKLKQRKQRRAVFATLAGVFVVGLWYAGAFSWNC